jgi:hypothetical protein
MAQERFLPSMPVTRQVELQQLIREVESPPVELPTPTEEQARALDQVFAAPTEERNPLVDGLSLAAAGMLFHDLVKDTLNGSEEDEDEEPAAKPKEPDPEPEVN